MSIDKYNAEGYYDPVTYEALTKIEIEQRNNSYILFPSH